MGSLRLSAEHIVLLAALGLTVLAFVQLDAPFSQWRWSDSFPPHFTTVDPLVYTWHARQIWQTGNLFTYTDSTRGLPRIIPAYPPLQGLLTASIGQLATVNVHHLEWIMVVIETLFVPVGMFLMVRRLFSSKAALLTLAFGLFAPPMWFFKSYIGHWGDVLSFFFVPAILILTILSLRTRTVLAPWLMGVLLAAMLYAHAFEVVFVSLFVAGGMMLHGLLTRHLRKSIIQVTIVSVTAILLVAHFFPVVLNIASSVRTTGDGKVLLLPGAGQLPSYYPRISFAWPVILLTAIGMWVVTRIGLKKLTTERIVLFAFIIFLAAVSATHFIGAGYRLYREFYSLYFFAAVLPALGAYALAAPLLSRVGSERKAALLLVALVVAVSLFFYGRNLAHFRSIAAVPLADREQWEGVVWISQNTPPGALVYIPNEFIHGFPIYFTNRNTIDSELNKDSHVFNLISLCNGTYPERWAVRCNGGWSAPPLNREGQPVYIVNRTGWRSFDSEEGPICNGYPPTTEPGFKSEASYLPMEYFDYVLLQYRGTGRWLGQNYDGCMAFFLNESIARGHQVVWNNDQMAVLKVNKSAA